ncbi:hypothetical protein NSMM_520038 [Nitrosomonas mobilis]|uniref:Tc1-like transposase DDE domain-containing protein n=2 Tax=Nitrosomonas mobilis TaxID=51642 RepID=A0A1G5SGX1_9PROT|nr:hypothetical protein NSMM_520038 [Nitrosomonas mobilis]
MRYADRIKGVYLLGSGWPVGRVAQALMVDRESMRNHHKRYRKGGLMALLRKEADGNGPTSYGVIDCNDLSATVRYDDTINAQSIIKRFQQIEPQNPEAVRIHVICDNARYYHARLVKDYLANSRIELVFLPPYAPNLNLIERFWKFLKKTILYGRYYETFCQFKTACGNFFAGLEQHHVSLRSLFTYRFQIIGRSRLSAKI